MDAAERSILSRGFQASTMEIIAREAGYSRAAMYQQFPNRRRLLEALVQRATQRHQAKILQRLPENADLATILVESLVIVASELINDPLLRTISEQTDEGSVAHLIANDVSLPQLVDELVTTMAGDSAGSVFRPGLEPADIGKFIIATALAMLLGATPGTDDPDTARRYLRTFFLPAILRNPPEPTTVFGHG
jgi:AcrR family transcriptional regulator